MPNGTLSFKEGGNYFGTNKKTRRDMEADFATDGANWPGGFFSSMEDLLSSCGKMTVQIMDFNTRPRPMNNFRIKICYACLLKVSIEIFNVFLPET